MNTNKLELSKEFLHDHQRMTRMLSEIVGDLKRGDTAHAQSLAEELDHFAGPHIAFEESVLYPTVGTAQGEPYRRKLLAEHDAARDGLKLLLSANDSQLYDAAFRRRVLGALQTGLKHAESCGTLVSHLQQLSSRECDQAKANLQRLRQSACRWTELAG